MNIRKSLLIAVVITLLLLLVGLLWKRPMRSASDSMAGTNTSPSVQLQDSNTATPGASSVASGRNSSDEAVKANNLADGRIEDVINSWKVPITFYGTVMDESGKPVSGAQVKFSWNDLSQKGNAEQRAVSGSDGSFSIREIQGKTLFVYVEKDGYYTPRAEFGRIFEYAETSDPHFHRPDSSQPVVFYLRKRGMGEELVTGQKLFGVKADGTPCYLNLRAGTKSLSNTAEWDVAVRIVRSNGDNGRKFDWSVEFQVPQGGIIETEEEFPFLAPETGYKESWEMVQRVDDPDWRSQIKKKFFIKSRNGQLYSRIEVTILPWYQKEAALDLGFFVNPKAGRILEAAQ